MVKEEWEKIETSEAKLWDFEKDGAELTGKLIEVRTGVGQNDSNIYTVEQEDGELRGFWGTTVLDGRLKNIEFGDFVKVVFLGRETSEKSGREYKNFEVYRRTAKGKIPEDVAPKEVPLPKEE